MQKKIKIIIQGKSFFIGEITVGEYWSLLIDYEQFIEEFFLKYGINPERIKEKEMKKIMDSISGKKDSRVLENILSEEKKNNDIEKDFHIVIGRFMYAMHLPFSDVINMPLTVFERMMKDFEYICGEKDKKIGGNKDFSGDGKPEKSKLKKIFYNQ